MLSDIQLSIVSVSLLATFDIEQALDVHGDPIPPNEAHKSAIIRSVVWQLAAAEVGQNTNTLSTRSVGC